MLVSGVVAATLELTITEGMMAAHDDFEASGLGDIERLAAQTPLARVAVPDDVARAILFAASDLAAFISGSNISVDGGLLAVG